MDTTAAAEAHRASQAAKEWAEHPPAVAQGPRHVLDIPLEHIVPDPEQPRRDFDLDALTELAGDIERNGVMQPITVRPHPDDSQGPRYIIVMGERRWRASQMAGRETIPALVAAPRADDPLERLFDQVKENALRRDLNPLEWAGFLRRLRDEHQVKAKDLVEVLREHGITHIGESYCKNLQRLLDLPDWAQALVRAGTLTPAHGKYILSARPSEAVLDTLRRHVDRSPTPARHIAATIEQICDQYQDVDGRILLDPATLAEDLAAEREALCEEHGLDDGGWREVLSGVHAALNVDALDDAEDVT